MEVARVYHSVDVQQDVGVLFEQEEVLLLCGFLEALSVVVWDTVPDLRSAPVVEVD